MPEQDTLVTQDMLDRKGVWGRERVSPPVSESDIRKWAIAVYWPNTPPPIFWDEEYAKTTRWGGIIAPPDFNPFAWPIVPDRAERAEAKKAKQADKAAAASDSAEAAGMVNSPKAGRGQRGMNGGQVETYGVPMRPGNLITARNRLRDWEERETRLGLTLFSYSETEWRNEEGELVKLRVSTGIRY
ncbi:MAG: MaoC family dehydratase N-terminal domain-containing protein [Acidimicrobiales bacterium]